MSGKTQTPTLGASAAQHEPGDRQSDHQSADAEGYPHPARPGHLRLTTIHEGLEHLRVGARVELVISHGQKAICRRIRRSCRSAERGSSQSPTRRPEDVRTDECLHPRDTEAGIRGPVYRVYSWHQTAPPRCIPCGIDGVALRQVGLGVHQGLSGPEVRAVP